MAGLAHFTGLNQLAGQAENNLLFDTRHFGDFKATVIAQSLYNVFNQNLRR